jgi:hypothetical protein
LLRDSKVTCGIGVPQRSSIGTLDESRWRPCVKLIAAQGLEGTRKLSSPVPTKSIVGVKPGAGEPLFRSHVVRPSESTPATLALTGWGSNPGIYKDVCPQTPVGIQIEVQMLCKTRRETTYLASRPKERKGKKGNKTSGYQWFGVLGIICCATGGKVVVCVQEVGQVSSGV